MSNLVCQAETFLRQQGGRMTSQRRIILQVLEKLDTHPSAEQLFALAVKQDASINLSTVYRTLHWLEQAGLIRARVFDNLDASSRGSRFDKALPIEHHHFVCTVCNAVIEFDSQLAQALKIEFQDNFRAEVDSASIMLYGICASCRAAQAVKKPR